MPLPRGGAAAASGAEPAEPLYCCYGCRFAAEVTSARGEKGRLTWMLGRLSVAGFLTMAVMMLAMYQYRQQIAGPDAQSELSRQLGGVMQYAALVFSAPVFVLLGIPIFRAAADQARAGILSTDALVVVGVGAAFVYSYLATLRGTGDTYYETACVILVFITLGRWLEARGKLRASEAVRALERLLPDEVAVERDGAPLRVKPADVRPGDLLSVSAGDRIAADGVILRGRAHVDEQLVTGESTPVVREIGDSVRAGTLSTDGALVIRATDTGAASTLGRLIELLEQARNSRSNYQRLADRIATWFIPVTIILALVGAGLGLRRGGAADAIMTALAVLLIACPCALGIATPTAVWVALGRAAARHILIRDGHTLERLARVRTVFFDKTGTLTTGDPRVQAFVAAGGAREGEVLESAACAASGSTHALSRAVALYARQRNISPSPALESRVIAGRGVVALQSGGEVALGSAALMRERGFDLSGPVAEALARACSEARPVACVGWGGRACGLFAFDESLREDAVAALGALARRGVRVAVLTGDHAARGRSLAAQLNTEVAAELLPQDKLRRIEDARRAGGAVAMVGDGLNDAPALAAADVGIAMGCGADLTRESAAVCLAGNELAAVPWLLDLARRTVRTIKVNLFWAFAYNIIGIGLALTGRLSPIVAAAIMVVSSLLVVGNSLRLNRHE